MDQEEIYQNLSAEKRNFFKLSTLFILFFLILVQLIKVILKINVIPEMVSVWVAFACLFYLWLAEQRDIAILSATNVKLFYAQDALKSSHLETILSLVLSQEAKDAYTYGHSERVKQYAVAIGRELGLTAEELEILSRAAKLHDIGKIGIQDDILFCKGRLNDEQYTVIKTHPKKGVVILDPLKFLEREKVIVLHHHERFDGNGYPQGLKGEQIPLGARIVCVADAFDAMRFCRPYKKPLTKEEIIAEFLRNSGTQFDPKVVQALIKHIDKLYA